MATDLAEFPGKNLRANLPEAVEAIRRTRVLRAYLWLKSLASRFVRHGKSSFQVEILRRCIYAGDRSIQYVESALETIAASGVMLSRQLHQNEEMVENYEAKRVAALDRGESGLAEELEEKKKRYLETCEKLKRDQENYPGTFRAYLTKMTYLRLFRIEAEVALLLEIHDLEGSTSRGFTDSSPTLSQLQEKSDEITRITELDEEWQEGLLPAKAADGLGADYVSEFLPVILDQEFSTRLEALSESVKAGLEKWANADQSQRTPQEG